jgi:hypothetical protein
MNDSCGDDAVPIQMTREDKDNFKNATQCFLCNKNFEIYSETDFKDNHYLVKKHKTYEAYTKSNERVRDHCHLTVKYRGCAHSKCNLRCKNDKYNIDFFFHNGKGYDFHFIINAVGELSKELKMDITCIPNNSEKYMSWSLRGPEFQITFKDSMQFMACSLDKLVETQKKSNFKFPLMNAVFW